MAFTVALIPDTQFLSASATWIDHFQDAADWIVANQAGRNIQLGLHLGDVVADGSTTQFDRAVTPMETIWDSGVPYAACIGNHDYDGGSTTDARSDATNWNSYFGQAQYTGRAWWNGTFKDAGRSDNFYFTLTLGDYDTLVLVIEFYPRASVMTWAESVIAANPDKRVIVLTHAYLYPYGVLSPDTQPLSAYGLSDAVAGQGMWAVFEQYANVAMVVNGHDLGPPYASTRLRNNDGGSVVYQSYTNWQNVDEGGDGRVVLLSMPDDWSEVTRTVYNARTSTIEQIYTRTQSLDPLEPSMSAESDIAAIADGASNPASRVRTALTSVLGRADGPPEINPAGTYSKPGFQFTGDVATQALGSALTLRYEPIVVRDPITVDAIVGEVTSASAGSSIRAGIYAADADWQPAALLASAAEQATTSTGIKIMAITPLDLPQGNYLVAFAQSAHSTTWRNYGVTSNWVDDALGASAVVAQFALAAASYTALQDPGQDWGALTSLGGAARCMMFLRLA